MSGGEALGPHSSGLTKAMFPAAVSTGVSLERVPSGVQARGVSSITRLE